jgi:hypothetical protein
MKYASGHQMKPKKRMHCAFPNAKRLRDECIVEHVRDACTKWIDNHIWCLREEGLKVRFNCLFLPTSLPTYLFSHMSGETN